jgi:hypothetical protein
MNAGAALATSPMGKEASARSWAGLLIFVRAKARLAPAETFAFRAQGRSEALGGHMGVISHSVR